MCVVAFAWQAHPRWPLVLIANRDESHARPSAALSRWPDHPELLAGRDRLSGGTWLGVTDAGRIACVTNVPSPGGPDPTLRSRGALVVDALRAGPAFLTTGAFAPDSYNPFNLIVVDRTQARFASNRPEAGQRTLQPGFHGFSNGPATPVWPKTAFLIDRLSASLAGEKPDDEALLSTLRTVLLTDGEADGPFILNGTYGTRCSTIVRVDQNGEGMMIERGFDANGLAIGDAMLPFRWG